MTKDEIMQIKANLDTDWAVAEKVMGWTMHPHKTHWIVGERDLRTIGSFRPSRDIAHAWEVAEWIGSFFIDNTAPSLGIDVEFFRAGRKDGYKATADTAPLAICRAALMAVSEE